MSSLTKDTLTAKREQYVAGLGQLQQIETNLSKQLQSVTANIAGTQGAIQALDRLIEELAEKPEAAKPEAAPAMSARAAAPKE